MEANLEVNIPSLIETFYTELKTTPFYKTKDGYQFAGYLLSETETETEIHSFLTSVEEGAITMIPDALVPDMKAQLEEALQALSALLISDQALTVWMTSKKAVGAVEEYHRILDRFRAQVLAILCQYQFLSRWKGVCPVEEQDLENNRNRYNYGGPQIPTEGAQKVEYADGVLGFLDLNRLYQKESDRKQQNPGTDKDVVLNHRNPFADISIREQQFLFSSDYGQFEVLGLSTNHTLTMVPKTGDENAFVLQPGFKIRKTKNLEESVDNLVLFDDTLSTETVQNDTNVYVYID